MHTVRQPGSKSSPHSMQKDCQAGPPNGSLGSVPENIQKRQIMMAQWANKLPCLDAFEILRAVFRFVKAKELKQCRLVNKVWNVEACAALRKNSYVRLFEAYQAEVGRFQNTMRIIRNLGTPCPFQQVHFSAGQLKYENIDMLLNGSLELTNFYVHEPPSSSKVEFQKHLYQIMISQAENLESFHCALHDFISFGLLSHQSRPRVELPKLREFGYWEGDIGPKPFGLKFVLEIINGSPNLERFHPKIFNDKTLHKVFKNTCLFPLKELNIQAANPSVYPQLLSLQLPGLRILKLQVHQQIVDTQKMTSDILQGIVSNFSQTLEELSICWPSNTPDASFPICPNLRSLCIDNWMGSLGLFDPKCLPALKKLHKIYNLPFGFNAVLNPHEGVDSLIVEDRMERCYPPHIDLLQSVEEEYTYFFEYICCQYPNLKSLDLTLPLSNSLLTSIVRIFPQLESLTLENGHSCFSLSEQIFTGVNKHTLSRYVVEGGRCPQAIPVPRMPCLLDLKRLKQLILSRYSRDGYPSHMMLSNNALKYGVGRMRSLESFQLNWNQNLSTSVARESLSHLKKIVVVDAFRYQPFQALAELKNMMPQVEFE